MKRNIIRCLIVILLISLTIPISGEPSTEEESDFGIFSLENRIELLLEQTAIAAAAEAARPLLAEIDALYDLIEIKNISLSKIERKLIVWRITGISCIVTVTVLTILFNRGK